MKKALLYLFFCFTFFSSFAQGDAIDEALAYQYYQQADYEKASVLLEKLFNKTKSDNYFELYFTSLTKIKKYTQAENILKKLIKQNPANNNYTLALGRVYLETGRLTEANKIFEDAINKTAKDEYKTRELANNFYRFEAYDMAIATFLQGRKALGDDKAFVYELLSIYRYKKDKPMLIQEYLNVLPSTPELLPQAQSVLANLFEDNNDYVLLQSALLKKIQKEPQTEVYTELLIWQFIQQQEYEMALRQLIAQDKRTKSNGEQIYVTANTFINNKAFATAVKAYEYILTKGDTTEFYLPSKLALINAKYEMAISGKITTEAVQQLANEYNELINTYGKSPKTLFALKKLAYLQAYYLNNLSGAETTLEQALAINGLAQTDAAQLKMDLGDVYVLTNKPWDAILTYQQVAKQYENQPIGNEANYRSAKLYFYQGDFTYAKAQADVLKAATSQLIANDALNLSLLISDNLQSKNDSLALCIYAKAEQLSFTNQLSLALAKLDTIDTAYPNNSLADDILMAKAKIAIKQNEFTNAADFLKAIIATHNNSIWIDDALFTLADLMEKNLNDTNEAKKLYQQLITSYPGSMFNAEARKRFRNLRGDGI